MRGGGIGKGRDERRRMEGRSGVENETARGAMDSGRGVDHDVWDEGVGSGRNRDRGERGRSSEGGSERDATNGRGWKGEAGSKTKRRAERWIRNAMSTMMCGMKVSEAGEGGNAGREGDARGGDRKGTGRTEADGREKRGRKRNGARSDGFGTRCRP